MRWFAPLLLVAPLAVGCGASLGQATGKVTWKGTAAARADVVFAPEADPDAAVYGVTVADGSYHLDYARKRGILAGKCKVTVTWFTLRDGKPLPDGEAGAALRGDDAKVVRHVYQFEKDVAAGLNAFNFELTEGRPVQ